MRLNKLSGLSSGLACLKNWWLADRIRISPQQGKLVSIQLPALLDIAGERWRVQSQCEDMLEGKKVMRYVCLNNNTKSSELWVFMPNSIDWRSKVLWMCEGKSRFLEETLITVYSLRNG